MVFMVILFISLRLMAAAQGQPFDSNPDELLRLAQDLQSQHRDREALELYLRVLEADPDNFTAICGASYLYGEIGKRFQKTKQQREYYGKALSLASRAYEMDRDHPESNLVMAWARGGIALVSGTREKIEAGKAVKQHIDVVLKKEPADDRAWYILANIHSQVASANFVQRAAARLIYGGLPENMTHEQAVEAYQRAVKLRPDYILYRYELAQSLMRIHADDREDRLKKEQEALTHLKHAQGIPPLTEDDPAILQEVNKLIRRLSR
jgi:tetratricopeptide (TPR) repeat protein